MEENLSLFALALFLGLKHALEPDHILGVAGITLKDWHLRDSLKSGLYWGFGHTLVILFLGFFILVLKSNLSENFFKIFEATAAILLVLIGIYQALKFFDFKKFHLLDLTHHGHDSFKYSLTLGVIHGVVGSGVAVLLAASKSKDIGTGMTFLFLFGIGIIVGMLLFILLFRFSLIRIFFGHKLVQKFLQVLTSGLCILYGLFIFIKTTGFV